MLAKSAPPPRSRFTKPASVVVGGAGLEPADLVGRRDPRAFWTHGQPQNLREKVHKSRYFSRGAATQNAPLAFGNEFDVAAPSSEGLSPSDSTPYHLGELRSPAPPSEVRGSYSKQNPSPYPLPGERGKRIEAPSTAPLQPPWWAVEDLNL